jgi:hypothetical protein
MTQSQKQERNKMNTFKDEDISEEFFLLQREEEKRR